LSIVAPVPGRPPGRPRRADIDRTVLECARRLVAERGVANTSVEAVAAEAEVARATVYRRFPTKQALIAAAVGGLKDKECPPDCGDLRAYLLETFAHMRRGIEGCDGVSILASLLSHRHTHPELIEAFRAGVVTPARDGIRSALQAAIERGEARADLDVDVLSTMLVNAYLSYAVAGLEAGPDWPERIVSGLWPLLAAQPDDGAASKAL
jgi:AcrR family transcriptional regulator